MNVKEMTDSGLLFWYDNYLNQAEIATSDEAEQEAIDRRAECRAELLLRLSRGALAERKLAVAVKGLSDVGEMHTTTGVELIAILAIAEIEAMKE